MSLPSKHLTTTINRRAEDVYEFASNPENLPFWATGLSSSIEKIGNDWVTESPMGKVKIRIAPKNKYGVLDHEVIFSSGIVFNNPMRVIPNEDGCDVIFSMLKPEEMTWEKFERDADQVMNDLRTLKNIMETQSGVM